MRLFIFILSIMIAGSCVTAKNQAQKTMPLLVKKCTDFTVTGKGDNTEWTKTEWNYLTKLDSGEKIYPTKFKILYSSQGVYVLFNGDDNKISTTYDKDFDDLYKADVFEVFFHTDPSNPIYFEYEVNQLDKELVLLVPRIDGKAYGWIPWHYEKNRTVKKMISVIGGNNVPGASITSWAAELFFPYELFKPLSNVPPRSGTIWNANFYRLDYDSGKMIKWAWSPVERSFHEIDKFRPIKFE